MDKDRIAGAAKQAKGAIKEAVGKTVGDAKMTAEGKSDKTNGKVQTLAQCPWIVDEPPVAKN